MDFEHFLTFHLPSSPSFSFLVSLLLSLTQIFPSPLLFLLSLSYFSPLACLFSFSSSSLHSLSPPSPLLLSLCALLFVVGEEKNFNQTRGWSRKWSWSRQLRQSWPSTWAAKEVVAAWWLRKSHSWTTEACVDPSERELASELLSRFLGGVFWDFSSRTEKGDGEACGL